tara:strand:+ start:4711 stop:4953 length:243 start_codon:yes stop_codon:yes gene_type:complete
MIRAFLQVSILFESAMILESRREAPLLIWKLPIFGMYNPCGAPHHRSFRWHDMFPQSNIWRAVTKPVKKLWLGAAFLLHH